MRNINYCQLTLISAILIIGVAACRQNNARSSSLQNKMVKDTHVAFRWDTVSSILNSCNVYKYNDEIGIDLQNETGDENIYIELRRNDGNWYIKSANQPAPADCLFVSSQFRILHQQLEVDQWPYVQGSNFIGTLDVLILGKHSMFREPLVSFIDTRKWDTIRMIGNFSGEIK